MIGSVFVRFQMYMEDCHGRQSWKELLQEADLPTDKVYRSVRFYPDSEFDHLLAFALKKTGLDREVFLRQLGYHCGAYIIETYKMMVLPRWRTLDVVEKVGAKIYRSIQFVDINAPKSIFECERLSPEELVLRYDSPRKMCQYILGIIDAVAEHFGEKVIDFHEQCMNTDAQALECTITLRLVRAANPLIRRQ
jgi:hypothetical protein